jgi:crotonobetainyl-CoA:carnitine CoA-transferase CaiB-like acyl-CoA transferase
VLELASVLAGPSAGQFFAEIGARVIKVENASTSGDVTRTWKTAGENTDDRSAYFCSVNWGKQSIAVNLETLAGRDIVRKLAGLSDVVIASYKPGDAAKLGVDYETLGKENPRLIYAQITGYGSADPRVGYDAVIQAESGFMFLNGEPGGRSLKMPVALIDILAAHHLKEGILLALLERGSTGKGRLVEVSLIDAAVSSLANQATNYLVAGQIPVKSGSSHPNIAPYGDVFSTRDGKEILLAVGTNRQFNDLCAILEIPQVAGDPRFTENIDRVKNRGELQQLIQEAMSKFLSGQLIAAFKNAKVPAGAIRTIPEVVDDPGIRQLMLSNGSLSGIRTFAATMNSEYASHILPPPHFGEHTALILEQLLNFSHTVVQNLRKESVIK